MAGHSKWSNIKRRKAKVDEQRGRIFTKLVREIIISARQGGSDPEHNARLKLAIAKAREANMPNDNIQRAIMRGTGELEGVSYEELTYEGYGPGGIAVLLNIATDNRNRTASEIRYIFSRHDGSLGENGCVAWMFDPMGIIIAEISAGEERDSLILQAIEAGAEDVDDSDDDLLEIKARPEKLESVKEALAEWKKVINSAEVEMVSQSEISIKEPEAAAKIMRLVEMLEDHDDVQAVYTNADIPTEIMEQADL